MTRNKANRTDDVVKILQAVKNKATFTAMEVSKKTKIKPHRIAGLLRHLMESYFDLVRIVNPEDRGKRKTILKYSIDFRQLPFFYVV